MWRKKHITLQHLNVVHLGLHSFQTEVHVQKNKTQTVAYKVDTGSKTISIKNKNVVNLSLVKPPGSKQRTHTNGFDHLSCSAMILL